MVWISCQPCAFLAWFLIAGHAVVLSNGQHAALAGAIELATIIIGFLARS